MASREGEGDRRLRSNSTRSRGAKNKAHGPEKGSQTTDSRAGSDSAANEAAHPDDHGSDLDYEDGDESEGIQPNVFQPRTKRPGKKSQPAPSAGQKTTKAGSMTTKEPNSNKYAGHSAQDLLYELLARDEEVARRDVEVKSVKAKATTLRKEIKEKKQENTELKKSKKEADEKIDNMQATLHRFQLDHGKLVSKNKIEISTGTDVDGRFTTIFQKAKKWAGEWAKENLDDADIANLKELFSLLAKGTPKPFATTWVLIAARARTTKVWVVLNALLNRLLCSAIFGRPFAHLQGSLESARDHKVEESLDWLMLRAEKKSFNSQHRLRSAILRAVDEPLVEAGKVSNTATQYPMPQSRVEHCNEVVLQTLGAVTVLLKDTEMQQQEQRTAELFRIVEMASRLSGILSLQHPCIKYHFLDDLKEPRFRLKDPWFRTHRLLGLELDDDEDEDEDRMVPPGTKRLLGEPLDLIVVPAIVRFGDADAEHYDKATVVFQGTSWMVKDKNSLTRESAESPEAPGAPAPGEPWSKRQTPDSLAREQQTQSAKEIARACQPESTDQERTNPEIQDYSSRPKGARESSPLKLPVEEEFKIFEDEVESEAGSRHDKSTHEESRKAKPITGSESPQPASALPIVPSSSDPQSVEATINTSANVSATATNAQEHHATNTIHDGMDAYIAAQSSAPPKPPAESTQAPRTNADRALPKGKPSRSNIQSEQPMLVAERIAGADVMERQRNPTSKGMPNDTRKKVSKKPPAKRTAPVIDLTDQPDDVTNMEGEPKSKKQKTSPSSEESPDREINGGESSAKSRQTKGKNNVPQPSTQEPKPSPRGKQPPPETAPKSTIKQQVKQPTKPASGRTDQAASKKSEAPRSMTELALGELVASIEKPGMCRPARPQHTRTPSDS